MTFLGATGAVTGSRFLVERDRTRVLVDAGLYQGLKNLRARNWEPFPTPPATLDAVVLTHAHLDHCGYLPRLVKDGFGGPVYCTGPTADLAAIVLRDSAHLQQEDAAHANASGYSKHNPAMPLYDERDVQRTLRLFRPVTFHEVIGFEGGMSADLRSAGHILGSATVLVDTGSGRVLFSGDLGRLRHPLAEPREDPPAAETVVVESTYGNRQHPPPSGVLAAAIRRTVARGGTVLIPAFAVDRTELVLLRLGDLMRAGEIPVVPVYVDSPMAIATLDVYRPALERSGLPRDYGVPGLRTAAGPTESMALNAPKQPCILVSASGMGTGGRVVHHLAHQLPEQRNCVILTGYQAEGTRGRDLADGARQVKIHGRYVRVRAEVVVDDEFSAHADADELVGWLGRIPQEPRTTFVVHGERASSEALARRIQESLGWSAVVPRYGERVRLD